MKSFYFPIFFLFAGIFLAGCGSVKLEQMTMFKDVQTETAQLDTLPMLRIRSDDIINIQVASNNPETVVAFQQFNLGAAAGPVASAGENALGVKEGYRVDEEGSIYLPFIGSQKVEGMTLVDLRKSLTAQISKFVPDASVQVRFANFRVTLLGEVLKPNTYIIPNERLTLLEAIGMAGDFTPYADRNNVLVIRERNNVREFARINALDKTLFLSPYFYLSPNDIIYIEPLKAKQYATQGGFLDRYGVVIISAISLIGLLAGVFL